MGEPVKGFSVRGNSDQTMFTGIIQEVGTVRETQAGRLVIEARRLLEGARPGDSIAVNGVDLTVVETDGAAFVANVMPETYRRSNLGRLRPSDPVNLERALRAGEPLGGHFVQGHVDGQGALVGMEQEGEAVLARYEAPRELMRYVVEKGSIAVDGVSLTVVKRDETSFVVSLVQYTQQNTNLTRRPLGDTVNLEVDMLAKYVEQLLSHPGASHS